MINGGITKIRNDSDLISDLRYQQPPRLPDGVAGRRFDAPPPVAHINLPVVPPVAGGLFSVLQGFERPEYSA
ncbi:hypothetical protein FQA39_LY14801 [Lamprigera yunnana]|nr:hypothetical protein FQA39_LY14801 [Lamprigera yunnana]